MSAFSSVFLGVASSILFLELWVIFWKKFRKPMLGGYIDFISGYEASFFLVAGVGLAIFTLVLGVGLGDLLEVVRGLDNF